MDKLIEYSVVIPVYNSCHSIEELVDQLISYFKDNKNSYEIILIDDGSSDNSWQTIKKITNEKRHLKGICLSRNFGQHNALMCGLNHSKGLYAITMDDDLQHPIEGILKLREKIDEGFDIVYAVSPPLNYNKIKRLGRKFVYFCFKKVLSVNHPISAYRMIKKDIVDKAIQFKKHDIILDIIFFWITNRTTNIGLEFHQRKYGKSNYDLKKLVKTALNILYNFSVYPLRLISILGTSISIISFFIAVYYILRKIIIDDIMIGFSGVIVSIFFFSGLILLSLGIIGEYLARIFLKINNKPQYFVHDKEGFHNETY